MGAMSELDLAIRELIFEGTLGQNLKENVGVEIKIKDYFYVVTKEDVTNYYNSERARQNAFDWLLFRGE